MILVFDGDGKPASFDLPLKVSGIVENMTLFYPFYAQNRSTQIDPYAVSLDSKHAMPQGALIHLEMVGPSSLYVEADRISFASDSVAGKIAEKDTFPSTEGFARFKDRRDHLHRNFNPPASAVLQYQPLHEAGFQLVVEGTHRVEWHGAAASCSKSDWCPDGGPRTTQRFSSVHDLNISSESFSYQSINEAAPTVQGEGHFAYAILGGPELGLTLNDGSLRLPLATTADPCATCTAPRNQTLTVMGNVELAGLRRAGQSALTARLGGDFAGAKLDETSIDPAVLMGVSAAGAVVVVAIGVVAAKVLGLLFTRWRDDDVLALPRRRLIYDAIVSQPGITFRELTRATGLSVGAVSHHIPILLRHGKIMEKREGKALHFFENHGKYDRAWGQTAALRDAMTLRVHDWLAQHPNSTQKDVLSGLATLGVSRTAAQRRLDWLLDAGLATAYWRGRYKVYRAV